MSERLFSRGIADSRPLQTIPAASVWHLVEIRAHELYEQRGKEEGHEKEDWLRAESEIANRFPSQESPEAFRHSPATAPAMPFYREL